MRIATAQQASSALIRIFLFGCSLSFCMLYSNLAAQSRVNPHFEIFSSDDNSAPDNVRAILQDRQGFIWIGTLEGLYRYDGYSFKRYQHDPDDPNTLSTNFISFVFEDSQGSLWIGSGSDVNPGHLNHLDPATGKFQRFSPDPDDPNSIGSDQVYTLFEDSDHMLWLGTKGDGLIRFDPSTGTFKRFMHDPDDPNSIGGDHVSGIFEDTQGFLWVYHWLPPAYGVNRLDRAGEKFQRFPHDPDNTHSLSYNRIKTHLEDAQGKLWFGTFSGGLNGGLNRYDPLTKTFERFVHDPDDPASLSDDRIRVIYEDVQQNIWIGTWDGLNRFDRTTGKFQRFTHDPEKAGSICGNYINHILEDPAGNLWIATQREWDGTGGGLALMNRADDTFECFYSGSQFTSLMKDAVGNIWFNPDGQLGRIDLVSRKFPPPFPFQQVTDNGPGAIMEDSDGYVWAASVNPPHGLYRLDRTTGDFLHLQHDPNHPQESIGPHRIISLFEDSEGYLWLGNGRGYLDQLDRTIGKLVKRFRVDRKDSTAFHGGGATRSIIEDREGNLWFGGDRLEKLNKATGFFQHFDCPGVILKMILDSQGYLWIGKNDGLWRLDPATGQYDEFSHDSDDPNSLSHPIVNTLIEDSQQSLWVGTGESLNHWNPATGKFTRYHEKDGLHRALITGIVEDDHGRLWLQTLKGLSCFDPKTETFQNFDVQDGLQGAPEAINSYFNSPRSGELYFGGPNGLTIFHPDSIRIDTLQPKVAIASFSHYKGKNGQAIVDDFISAKEEIILSHKDNMLSFEFAALHFRNSSKTQYKYQLNGSNDQWYNLGHKREVTFTDLAPRIYTLRVIAINRDGVESSEPAQLAIKVTPPLVVELVDQTGLSYPVVWPALWFVPPAASS